jgi:methyl-accepting chemotaxis protein
MPIFAARVRVHQRLFPQLRIGLKLQIALLGITGVLFTGAICLAGLHLAARTQLESDQSVNLRLHVLGLSANYLEARQIANEFLRKHDEKLIDKHAQKISCCTATKNTRMNSANGDLNLEMRSDALNLYNIALETE